MSNTSLENEIRIHKIAIDQCRMVLWHTIIWSYKTLFEIMATIIVDPSNSSFSGHHYKTHYICFMIDEKYCFSQCLKVTNSK